MTKNEKIYIADSFSDHRVDRLQFCRRGEIVVIDEPIFLDCVQPMQNWAKHFGKVNKPYKFDIRTQNLRT